MQKITFCRKGLWVNYGTLNGQKIVEIEGQHQGYKKPNDLSNVLGSYKERRY